MPHTSFHDIHHSFLLLNNTTLYENVTFLSTCQLVDIWASCTLRLLRTLPVWTFVYKSFTNVCFPFFWTYASKWNCFNSTWNSILNCFLCLLLITKICSPWCTMVQLITFKFMMMWKWHSLSRNYTLNCDLSCANDMRCDTVLRFWTIRKNCSCQSTKSSQGQATGASMYFSQVITLGDYVLYSSAFLAVTKCLRINLSTTSWFYHLLIMAPNYDLISGLILLINSEPLWSSHFPNYQLSHMSFRRKHFISKP